MTSISRIIKLTSIPYTLNLSQCFFLMNFMMRLKWAINRSSIKEDLAQIWLYTSHEVQFFLWSFFYNFWLLTETRYKNLAIFNLFFKIWVLAIETINHHFVSKSLDFFSFTFWQNFTSPKKKKSLEKLKGFFTHNKSPPPGLSLKY